MGGTQSWMSCDATYPAPNSANAAPFDENQANGDPIIGVIMFLVTLFGLLLLTALVHCGIIALRSLRHHRRHRRHQRTPQPQPLLGVVGSGVGDHQLATPSAAAVPHPASDVSVGVDVGEDGDGNGETSSTSSVTSSSSESSLDSTTARIAAQVASRRRQSRLMMLADSGGGGGGGRIDVSPSPAQSERPANAGGIVGGSVSGFLMPPSPYALDAHGGYANRGYDSRFDS